MWGGLRIKMKELLTLSPVDYENNKPTKILNKKLEKLESFDAGFKFNFDTIEYNSFHDAIVTAFENPKCFIVLGELTDHGRMLHEKGESGPRRKKKGTPTIQDLSLIHI